MIARNTELLHSLTDEIQNKLLVHFFIFLARNVFDVDFQIVCNESVTAFIFVVTLYRTGIGNWLTYWNVFFPFPFCSDGNYNLTQQGIACAFGKSVNQIAQGV